MNCIKINDKNKCCGCGNCVNKCPKNAISFKEDKIGFVYPVIDFNNCVDCGICKSVCPFDVKVESNKPVAVYAAASYSEQLFEKSSSGAIFPTIARYFIMNDNIVGGAKTFLSQQIYVEHILINSIDNLGEICGSKYVQSDISNIFSEIRKVLLSDKEVLFVGTPCQVVALKKYLGNIPDNLTTVDIVCHGVPSKKLLNDYLNYTFKNQISKIVDISFRSKKMGWGHLLKVTYQNQRGRLKTKYIPAQLSSYFYFFLKGRLSRDCCTRCPFSGESRCGDITLGDCWGIGEEYPQLLIENGGNLDTKKGVSIVLVNTEKGKKLLDCIKGELTFNSIDLHKVSKYNQNLSGIRDDKNESVNIKEIYEYAGYAELDKAYKRELGIRYYKMCLASAIPQNIKNKIKKLL